jgi:hypothetical protein
MAELFHNLQVGADPPVNQEAGYTPVDPGLMLIYWDLISDETVIRLYGHLRYFFYFHHFR